MAGLLDNMFGGGQQGLLAGSMALLEAGGPSPMPVSFGQGFARAMGAMQKQQRDAQELDMKRKQQQEQSLYRQAQIKKMEADTADDAETSATIRGLLSKGASPDVLEQVGNQLLLRNKMAGQAYINMANQHRAAADKQSEWDGFKQTEPGKGGLMGGLLPADDPVTPGNRGLDLSRVSPEMQAFLKAKDPEAFAAGVARADSQLPPQLTDKINQVQSRINSAKTGDPVAARREYDDTVRQIGVLRAQQTSSTDRKALQQANLDSRPERSATVTEIMENGKRIKIDANTGRKIGDAPTTGAGDIPKLKQGERWNAEKEVVEAVPGSDIYIKQSGLHSKDYNANQTAKLKFGNAIDKIKELLDPKNKDAFESNFGGYTAEVTKYTPGAANTMRNKIESIKSDLKSAGLELMRSGGSIGQMTEREWPIVERVIANITPQLDDETAKTELQRVITYLGGIKNNAQDVYDTEWGQSQYFKSSGPKPGHVEDGYRFKGGNPKNRLNWEKM